MEYIILIISLIGIVFGADFLVAGSVSIAKKYHKNVGIGHLTRNDQTGILGGELWANFFSAQMTQDTETLSKMKAHFPTAYAAMEQMALDMAKS